MLADTPVEQRGAILKDSCDQIVERSYTRKFGSEETNERRAELAEVAIQVSDLEEELASIRAEYKAKIKPLFERIAAIRNELKAGGEWVKAIATSSWTRKRVELESIPRKATCLKSVP